MIALLDSTVSFLGYLKWLITAQDHRLSLCAMDWKALRVTANYCSVRMPCM